MQPTMSLPVYRPKRRSRTRKIPKSPGKSGTRSCASMRRHGFCAQCTFPGCQSRRPCRSCSGLESSSAAWNSCAWIVMRKVRLSVSFSSRSSESPVAAV
ncbi:unnamed protein product [Symbiodinium sp. CCMP2592]|nr:unnamed protein product [Symbiodinium sp. CCMP2592]